MPRSLAAVPALIAAAASPTLAQSFTNGNFETGSFSGWTITPTPNGQTAAQSVEQFDIDGPGPLPTSFAAHFEVGQVASVFQDQEGIELAQTLSLSAGVQYQVSLSWAAVNISPTTDNAEGGVFTLFADTTDLTSQAAGFITHATSIYGALSSTFTPATSGAVRVGVRITRPYTIPGTNVNQWIDNASFSGGQSCYANCDQSTAPPVLNVADFTCFLQKFSLGDPYANCDNSTAAPILNVADFTCFLQKFAQGCP